MLLLLIYCGFRLFPGIKLAFWMSLLLLIWRVCSFLEFELDHICWIIVCFRLSSCWFLKFWLILTLLSSCVGPKCLLYSLWIETRFATMKKIYFLLLLRPYLSMWRVSVINHRLIPHLEPINTASPITLMCLVVK